MTNRMGGGRGERLGAWLFVHRGWLPVPLLIGMAVSPVRFPLMGLVILAIGEGIRFWAVGHIGLPSRTRGDGAHRVVDTGPYAAVRNPLYVGNLVLFTGLGVMVWPWALLAGPLLAVHYHFIVRWEEANLGTKLGAAYVEYCSRVPRWLPNLGATVRAGWDLRQAVRSERSTLLAIGVVLGAMGARAGMTA